MTALKFYTVLTLLASHAALPQCSAKATDVELDGIARYYGVPCEQGTLKSIGKCDAIDTPVKPHISRKNSRVIYVGSSTPTQPAAVFVYFDDPSVCFDIHQVYPAVYLKENVKFGDAEYGAIYYVGVTKSGKTEITVELRADNRCIRLIEARGTT